MQTRAQELRGGGAKVLTQQYSNRRNMTPRDMNAPQGRGVEIQEGDGRTTCARWNRTTGPLGPHGFEARAHHQAGSCTPDRDGTAKEGERAKPQRDNSRRALGGRTRRPSRTHRMGMTKPALTQIGAWQKNRGGGGSRPW